MVETAADALIKAAENNDHRAAHRLIVEAGGACQARDLAKLAKDSQGWYSRQKGTLNYDVKESGDNETLTITNDFWGNDVLTALTQKKCEKK